MSCRRIVRGASLVGAIVAVGIFVRQVAAEDLPKLSYGFQKGRQYQYNVKIVADLPDVEETQQGDYTYDILDAADSQFTVKASGGLAKSVKAKPGVGGRMGGPPRRGGPPRFAGPPRRFGPLAQPARPAGTTLGRQGNLIIVGNLTQLPLLLGCAEMLVIEPFPTAAKAAWDTQTGLGVVERKESSWHHIGPFSETEVAHGATERIDYSVLETTPDTVRISKKYALHTTPDAAGAAQIDMTGNGEFAFDRKEGLIKSQTMKYEIRVSESNINVTIPLTLDFRLLTAAEVAEHKQKIADAAAAAAEAARPKPFAAGERTRLIKDLQSGDLPRVQLAAKRLTLSIRDDNPSDICRALCRAMKTADSWTQPAVMQALKIWATPEAEKTVIAAVKSENVFLSGPAVEALENFKSEAAAAAAGEVFPRNRTGAAKAMKAMGAIAEPYAIPYASSHDVFVRAEAWGVLAAIGGKKSLEAMKAELAKAAWHEKDAMQKVIGSIEARLESGADDAAAAQPATPASAASKPRTWHDVTGTYKIEATLVSSADGKVTLKRTDGTEVTLPVAKLSAEDRAFVEKEAKPPNPFE